MIIIIGAGLAGLTCAKDLVQAGKWVSSRSGIPGLVHCLRNPLISIADNFARPFYGGIFLDRSLMTSTRMFQFTFKMLATGDTMRKSVNYLSAMEKLMGYA